MTNHPSEPSSQGSPEPRVDPKSKIDLLDASEKQRIDILLKVFDACVAQERAIKDEEAKWVTYVLLFYAAFLGALTFVAREMVSPSVGQRSIGLHPLVPWGFAFVAIMSHVIFARTFSVLRFAYYRVRPRLQRTAQLLRLDDPDAWPGGRALQGKIESVEGMRTAKEWVSRTLPRDSFVSRLSILMLGHMPAWLLLLVCFDFQTVLANAVMLGFGIGIPVLTAAYHLFEDYRTLLRIGRRDAARRMIASFRKSTLSRPPSALGAR